MDELSTILAHEIKNPMNSIIINIEVLRNALLELTSGSDSPASQRAKKYLDVIEDEIRRLDKVIRGFLDFARPSQSTKVKFKLAPVIESILEFMSNELRQRGIQVLKNLADPPPSLVANSDQIKQALFNLILNAIQAMPNGGALRITLEETEAEVILSIEDSGQGIDDAVKSKIFDPYFTTKAKGSGLGLSVVKRVIRDHGGRIEVQSTIRKGSVFTLRFPKGKC